MKKLCILMLVVSGMFVSCEGFPTVEKPNNALVGSWERKGSYVKILCDSPWQERMDEIVAMLRVEFFNTLTFKNDGSGLFTISSTDPEKMFYYSLTDDEITATAEDLIYGFNAGSIDVSGEIFIMSYDIEGNTLNVKMDITEKMKEVLGNSVYGQMIDPNVIEVAHIAGTYIRK